MATPSNEVESPSKVLRTNAADFFEKHNPAEAVVAGKARKKNGVIADVFVLWPLSALSGKAKSGQETQFDQAEINEIGKLFDQIRQQPTNLKPFKFMRESYQPKKEQCTSQEPHMHGAVCFSGLKYNHETKKWRQAIYALMTADGYVIVVKTKSFKTTRFAVERGKGLAHNVQNAALSYYAGV